MKLECRSRTNGTVTLTKEAVTDKTGSYRMEVTGDHEEEVCELVLVESPDSGCSDVSKEAYLRNAAKISLTANDGIVSHETRIVNVHCLLEQEEIISVVTTWSIGCRDLSCHVF